MLLVLCLGVSVSAEVRLKDLATVRGVREIQVAGVGLVTGVNGQGDSASSGVLQTALRALLTSFGFDIGDDDVKSRNCAVVLVSADLPAFARAGDRLTVTVSSIGDAKSVDGGVLLQTPLRAANGDVYAMAQGRVYVPAGTRARTVGAIESGAIVEDETLSSFSADGKIALVLLDPDFSTASAIATAVRGAIPDVVVVTRDAALVEVEIPTGRSGDVVSFLAELEGLRVQPDPSGRVVVDPQSGVIILGEGVRIGRVAVSYEDAQVSVGMSSVFDDDTPSTFAMEETTSVGDFVEIMQTVGLGVDTIIGILRAVERAGALYGRLVIM